MLWHKLKTISIKKVDWKNVPTSEVMSSLRVQMQMADSDHGNVKFTLSPRGGRYPHPKTISLRMENASVLEIMKKLPLIFTVGDNEVLFQYSDGDGIWQVTRIVPSEFIKVKSAQRISGSHGQYDVAQQLQAKGMTFVPAGAVRYDPLTNLLVLTGSWEMVEELDELLNP